MSQNWAAYHGIAMVLNEKEFNDFLDRYCKKQNLTRKTLLCEIDFNTFAETPFKASNPDVPNFYITEINNDICEGASLYPMMSSENSVNMPIYDQNGKLKSSVIVNDYDLGHQNCYAIFADKDITSGTIFLGPEYRYNTYDELLTEFKNKMKDYLPDDFDWNIHIGDFSYAAYA